MGMIEEIKRMQQEGKSDQEVVSALVEEGFSPKEIQDFLTQARIKEAVLAKPDIAPPKPSSSPQALEKMMPSVMDPNQFQQPSQSEFSAIDQSYTVQQNPAQTQQDYPYASQALPSPPSNYPYTDEYPPNQQPQDYPQQQQQDYYSFQGGVSTDTINEIAEQVVIEKLSALRNKIEEVVSFKNIMESKIDYLDERLKRIERTIDRLQLSVLQKVGDYITNVEDIKKELIETQKTFKAITGSQTPTTRI